jgi:hypothetical protein
MFVNRPREIGRAWLWAELEKIARFKRKKFQPLLSKWPSFSVANWKTKFIRVYRDLWFVAQCVFVRDLDWTSVKEVNRSFWVTFLSKTSPISNHYSSSSWSNRWFERSTKILPFVYRSLESPICQTCFALTSMSSKRILKMFTLKWLLKNFPRKSTRDGISCSHLEHWLDILVVALILL